VQEEEILSRRVRQFGGLTPVPVDSSVAKQTQLDCTQLPAAPGDPSASHCPPESQGRNLQQEDQAQEDGADGKCKKR